LVFFYDHANLTLIPCSNQFWSECRLRSASSSKHFADGTGNLEIRNPEVVA